VPIGVVLLRGRRLLQKLGMRVDGPNNGCCGLVGGFGFDPRHYAMAQRIGEHALLRAVRRAAADTLIVTGGFSCRAQIAHGAGRCTSPRRSTGR
jgi:Fe-S oxidoreductase